MSSGEEFEVEEILEQRKRKGILEYLVRWRGFNDLYDSWEPASGLADCTRALKAFTAKLQTKRSKSRSRSRGRKSKSRSRSRGRTLPSKRAGSKSPARTPKSDTTPKRSRSRSTGRKITKSSSTLISEVKVSKKEESSSLAEQKSGKLQSGTLAEEKKASSRRETVVEKATTSKAGEGLVQKTEVVKTTVETVKSTPSTQQEVSGMTTRSRLAVRQVANDQKPAPRTPDRSAGEKGTWWWWFADHAVLILFIIVSLIALSFTIESISGVRDKLVPDLGVLRQRLVDNYQHFAQGVSSVCSSLTDAMALGFSRIKAAVFFSGETPAPTPTQSPPPPSPAA